MDGRPSQSGLGPRHDASSRVQKPESVAAKLAALKARVADAIGTPKSEATGIPKASGSAAQPALHPALEDIGQWKRPGRQQHLKSTPNASLSSTTSQVAGLHERSYQHGRKKWRNNKGGNPYLDDNATASQGSGGKARQPRELVFNQKGKYIQQASAMRRQAALEEMKKKIAMTTRRTGIDDDPEFKQFVVEAPPKVEWWDEPLLDGYDRLDAPSTVQIATLDSTVTEYIQHPVALEPPQERNALPDKSVYLTKSEQKRIRRQRRMRELKEQQAKQRLGLEPAPPPKVKKSNLMRVLGEAAVKDPTAVEARVTREIQERHQNHLQANEERKLTKDQRHEKLAANQEKDAAMGIRVLVFRIGSLANGQHRYKIGINAEQHGLTGICIMNPKFNLVVVEGGEHSIKKYKKLLLNRIDWTENSPSRDREGARAATRDWLLAEREDGVLKDLSLNECRLVFEGFQKSRSFRKWSTKVCETETEARDVLARSKMENVWSLAKGAP